MLNQPYTVQSACWKLSFCAKNSNSFKLNNVSLIYKAGIHLYTTHHLVKSLHKQKIRKLVPTFVVFILQNKTQTPGFNVENRNNFIIVQRVTEFFFKKQKVVEAGSNSWMQIGL